MGYCPFSSSGRDTVGLYCDKQGAGACQGTTRPGLCAGARSSARDTVRNPRDTVHNARDTVRNTRDMVLYHDTIFCVTTESGVRVVTRRSNARHDAATLRPTCSVCATWAQCTRDLGSGCAHCAHNPVLRQYTV